MNTVRLGFVSPSNFLMLFLFRVQMSLSNWMKMNMKRKVLLSSLFVALVILFTELFVVNDYLPSVRRSKKYYERLTQRYKTERLDFALALRTRTHNNPVPRKLNAKAINRSAVAVPPTVNLLRSELNRQSRNVAKLISNTLSDEVKRMDSTSRLIRKNSRVISRGESKLSIPRVKLKRKKSKQVKSGEERTNKGKIVLIYTPLFDEKPWKGIRNTYDFTHYRGAPCAVTNCSITYRHRFFSRSDIVIFHGQDMPDDFDLKELNRRRPKGQLWVYFVLESPVNAKETYFLNDMFNWTMTYERDADIFLPYGSYVDLKPGEQSPYGQIIPGKKDRLLVWTVSNCGGLRDWYVEELRNHIRVDVFGSCAEYVYQPHLQEDECEKDTPECENLLKRYKFQLALENGNCIDYITEKYWGLPLELGIVPVVLGGANYSEMAIPGSYINVLDFDSVKALADYLLYLDKNDTAYMEYFVWRKWYKVHGYLTGMAFNEHYPWTCDLCAKVQNPESKWYKRIRDFRDSATHCGLHEQKIYEMLSTGGDDDIRYRTDQTDAADVDEPSSESKEEGDGRDEDEDEQEGEDEVVEDETDEENKKKRTETKQSNDENKVIIKGRKIEERLEPKSVEKETERRSETKSERKKYAGNN